MAMKTGMVALSAVVAVIAGGAVTGEPRGMRSRAIAFEGDIYIPCLGAYISDFASLTRPMLQLQYHYRLTVSPDGELGVYRKNPHVADWTRCVGVGH